MVRPKVTPKSNSKTLRIKKLLFGLLLGHFGADPESHFFVTFVSTKTKGLGERMGPPEIIQKFCLRKCRCPYDSYGRQTTIMALFRRRILGQYPAANCSPGPFVLLLIFWPPL